MNNLPRVWHNAWFIFNISANLTPHTFYGEVMEAAYLAGAKGEYALQKH